MHRTYKYNLNLLYVEYLSTAPWNRYAIKNKPKFRGIGTILLMQAVFESYNEGFHGRIGLHSLSRAEKFYKNFGYFLSSQLEGNPFRRLPLFPGCRASCHTWGWEVK